MDRRTFMVSTVAAAASCATANAQHVGPVAASAHRRDDQSVRITWSGLRGGVRVLASSDPDAPPALMAELASRARGGALVAPIDISPRPYFLLQDRDGQTVRTAERLLPLQGGRNFRDLGGYAAEQGGQVRWGRIYRSGVMTGLTEQDLAYLGNLGIRAICDLRSPQERESEPHPFAGPSAPNIAAFDYEMDSAGFGALFAARTREEAMAAFSASYVRMPDMLAEHFADLFARLAQGDTPLTINCSAGKDRTGMASALILSLLGVDRETIIADYALSEVYMPPQRYLAMMRDPNAESSMSTEQRTMFSRMPEEVLLVIMGTPAPVMRDALAQIDASYGGPIAMVKDRFGLTDGDIAYLRELYVA